MCEWSWGWYFCFAWVVGASLTQALFLAIHELTHNLFFVSLRWNKYFAFLCNFPIVFPFATSFRKYHLDHHRAQGVVGVDTDLPSEFELRWVQGAVSKTIWLWSQIVAYAIRPLFINPHAWSRSHYENALAQLAFDAAFVSMFGFGPLRYLVLCVFLAGGMHPCAGHFLSEHLVTHSPQETYSYYGVLNRLTWNVGFHNEHHDFPLVPWSRLPLVRELCPEMYDSLATCDSWIGIQYKYIADPALGPWSRKRRAKKE